MEDVNPNYWPGFPWAELAPFYDVWQPMGYWTNRRADSGWRDGYAYTAANIDRIRAHLGWLDAPVHPIGGIGDETTPEQIAGMVQASVERGALGGSIYDYRTTHDALWAPLQAFNALTRATAATGRVVTGRPSTRTPAARRRRSSRPGWP